MISAIPFDDMDDVWIDCYQAMDPATPFGGYTMSGMVTNCGRSMSRNTST